MARVLSIKKYKELLLPLDAKEFPYKKYLPVGLLVLDLLGYNGKLFNRSITGNLSELYGTHNLRFYLRIHQANKIVHALVGLLVTVFFGIIVNSIDDIFVIFSLGLVGGLYLLPDYELKQKIKKRRREIQMEFPDFLNKITLLISAGMTVPRAWDKVVTESRTSTQLYKELYRSLADIRAGNPLSQAYEDLARRCRMPEINKFVTAILQNMRKGNTELAAVLSVQAAECWEMRKHLARRLGEEASTKLLFPLILMFAAILIIVAAPAVLAMKGM